jgi:hypothetical protein
MSRYKLIIETRYEHLDSTLYDFVADEIDKIGEYKNLPGMETVRFDGHIKYLQNILEELKNAKVEEIV